MRTRDHEEAVNEWLVGHLTAAGRRTMLAALRRKKADQTAGRSETKSLTSLRLSPRAYVDIKRLAARLGQPLTTTVYLTVQVALVDAEFQERVGMLSVATRAR